MRQIDILIVDDEVDSAILSARQIEKSGCAVHWLRVDTAQSMRQALEEQHWDIILSDHIMPQFDAFGALSVLHELNLTTPLVVASGRIGEETAVELMRQGAAHYVSKDNLSRLPTVVNHVLADSEKHQLRIQQEKTRMAASRMEVAHTLAGGVSHEFNNLMVGVVTTAEILLQRNNEPAENEQLLQMIYDSGCRAVQVSKQLLAYAQGAKFNVSSIPTADIMAHVLERIQHVRDEKNIQVVCDMLPELGSLEGDKAQLSQLLEAVLNNAIEATASGGSIHITTFEHQEKRKTSTLNAGTYVGVRICDTGVGINEGELAHIFEPFYTTKFLGRGLGLAAAWGIAQSHYGEIKVESHVGEGSCFTILLPTRKEAAEEKAKLTLRKTFTEKKNVLLVEDDDMVISVTTTLLRHWGHTVSLAKDAKEALAQTHEKKEEIDLIILDLGLPDRSGADILVALRENVPSAPILLISGYPENEKVHVLLELEDTLFLRKPFSPEQISAKIHLLFQKA